MNKKNTVLITGANSLVAPYLIDELQNIYQVITTSKTNNKICCDLTNRDDVRNLIEDTNPDIIIHAAGLTDVELCEQKPDLAFLVNAMSVFNLVTSISKSSRFIYISTDQVYAGTHSLNHEDCVSPVNSYGRTKLGGELVALSHKNVCILRTNFFGKSRTLNKKTITDFFIDAFENQRKINLYSDLYFSPLHLSTLAEIVAKISISDQTGIYNIGSRDGFSKAVFARKIAHFLDLNDNNATNISSDEISGRTIRPKDLRMDVGKFEKAFKITMPTLEEELEKLVN